MRTALSALICSCLFAATAATQVAAKAIKKTARTTIEISAERQPDGTIAPEVSFSSPNPRCLSAERFPAWRDGHFNTVGSILYFRNSLDYGGEPPNGGYLTPVSPAGASPYVWGASWAGSTPVTYDYKGNVSAPLTGTVAEATSIYVIAFAGSKRFTNSPFKVKYWQGTTKVKLTCPPASKVLRLSY